MPDILVIDDDDSFRSMLCKMLARAGRGSSDIYLDSAMRLGAARCFAKPFKTEPFLQAVKELLQVLSR